MFFIAIVVIFNIALNLRAKALADLEIERLLAIELCCLRKQTTFRQNAVSMLFKRLQTTVNKVHLQTVAARGNEVWNSLRK